MSWSDCLHSETHLQALWGKLPKTASQTLAVIISRFGAAPFKEEQLLEAVPTGSVGVNYRLGLLRLLQSGLVFAVPKVGGRSCILSRKICLCHGTESFIQTAFVYRSTSTI